MIENILAIIVICLPTIVLLIPALYLISSNIVQVIQTVVINKQLELEDEKKKAVVSDDDIIDAKQIKAKE